MRARALLSFISRYRFVLGRCRAAGMRRRLRQSFLPVRGGILLIFLPSSSIAFTGEVDASPSNLFRSRTLRIRSSLLPRNGATMQRCKRAGARRALDFMALSLAKLNFYYESFLFRASLSSSPLSSEVREGIAPTSNHGTHAEVVEHTQSAVSCKYACSFPRTHASLVAGSRFR